jgi:hypothetical protein
MFDPDAIRARAFSEYARLCKEPAWKAWAWAEVKRLDEEELFKGIKNHILADMNKQPKEKND